MTQIKPIASYGSHFVCGSAETPGMGVTWYAREDGSVFAELTLGKAQQGMPGLAHGGATASLLDEAMGGAVWLAGFRVAAVNLNIDYLKPVSLGGLVTVIARIGEQKGKKITASGEVLLADGAVEAVIINGGTGVARRDGRGRGWYARASRARQPST